MSEDILLNAHKAGCAYARKTGANDNGAYDIAAALQKDEQDFFLAGYRGERRRMAGNKFDQNNGIV